jgi:hypothetical protein
MFYKLYSTISIFITCLLFTFTAQAQTLADADIKQNVTPISNPLASLQSLRPSSYTLDQHNFKHLGFSGQRQYGFMAEEMEAVFPHLVSRKNISYMYGKNSYRTAVIKSIDYNSLIPVLVAAINEQQAQIESLKAEIKQLKIKR